jgi:type II secretory pathway pseudopilin PulG
MWNAPSESPGPSRHVHSICCSPAGVLRASAAASGHTLLEVVFVLSLSVVLGAAAVPQVDAALEDVRSAAAARYVASRLQQARMDAISRTANVGWRFVAEANGYAYTPYVDGNGNGVQTHDILAGADPVTGATERLRDRFAGVDFGVFPDLPPVEAGGDPPGGDPVRLGSGNVLSFSPSGTASAGSLYLRSRRTQYVIRILGETGRVRVLKYEPQTRNWKPV